jgi:hypothetical protein
MLWYLLDRIFRSPWKAALAGFLFGTGATGFVPVIDQLFHAKSGHRDWTFSLLMLAAIPAGRLANVLQIGQDLDLKLGWILPACVNGLLGALIFWLARCIWNKAFAADEGRS